MSADADLSAEVKAIRGRPTLVRWWWVLRHHDRPVRFVISRLLMASGVSRQLTIQAHGFKLHFHNSSISQALWVHGSGSNTTEALFRRYLKPGDRVIDAGANIGYYALVSSTAVGDSGHVTAIEAHPRVAGYLRDNVALNARRNIEVANLAVGDTAGWLTFSDQSQDDRNCVVEEGAGRRMPVVTLDSLALPAGPIALLKIDVEGYEKFVLDGATQLLDRVQCVFIETWAQHFARYGYECRDVHERLVAKGFSIYRASGQELEPIATGYVSTVCEDLLAIRDIADFVRRTGYRVR